MRAVEQILVARLLGRRRRGSCSGSTRFFARQLVAEGADQGRDLVLDLLEGLDDLGDALAGDILEIAGLVDLGDDVDDLGAVLAFDLLGDRLDLLESRMMPVASSVLPTIASSSSAALGRCSFWISSGRRAAISALADWMKRARPSSSW